MKQVFNISAGNADVSSPKLLSIRLGEQHFGFAISSESGNELLQLTWYVSDQPGDQQLQEIFSQHSELRGPFDKVMIGYDHTRSVLVPANSPAKNDAKVLLETMYGVNGKYSIITENIAGWQVENIYAVPVETRAWVNKHFPSAHHLHNYSIGIKQVDVNDPAGSLVINFHNHDFMVIAVRSNQLLLAQSFSYSTPADVIFYLLKITNEFSLSQASVNLVLSGLIEKESSLYRELVHYFLNIRFREPAWQIPQTEGESYPSHFFTSLNDLATCES